MADTKAFISFEIDTSKAQQQLDAVNSAISKVKEQQEALNKAYEDGTISEQDYHKESDKISKSLDKLNEQQAKTKKVVDAENSAMGKLTKTATALGGQGGKAIGQMTSAVGGLNTSFKALIANPIMAVITLVVGVFMKLKDAIASNEELQNRLNVVFSAFKPIGNLVANIFDKIADFVVSCAEAVASFIPQLEKVVVKVSEFITKFTPMGIILKKFGIDIGETTKNAVEGFNEQSKATRQLEIDTQNLTKARRDFATKQAQINNQIADLQEDLSDKESLTYEQRMAKTKELTELRKKALEEEKRMAEEELRIAQAKAELAPNSAKDNEELAKLTQNVANAQAKLNLETKKGTKLVQAEQKAIESEKKAKLKAIEDERKKRQQELDKILAEQKKRIAEITKETEDDLYKQSLVGLGDYEKSIKEVEHARVEITKAIEKEIVEVEKIGNKQLADTLRERLRINNDALDKQLEEIEKKKKEQDLKDQKELEKRSQDIANKLQQAELKGKTGEELIEAELAYNKRVLEQKRLQDLQQENLTATDKLNIQKAYELERIELERQADEKIAENQKEQERKKQEQYKATLNVYKTTFSGMATITQNLNQLAEEGSKSQQALTRVGIVLQMAMAMANGISSAMEQSFPINLIAVAGTVAELLVYFKQIREVGHQKFAKGGLVGGFGSGTSDSNYSGGVSVSKGEAVINAQGTRMYGGLLNSINTSTGGEPIRTASNSNAFQTQLTNALSAQPRPIVSVVDINKGQDRVNYVKTIGSV